MREFAVLVTVVVLLGAGLWFNNKAKATPPSTTTSVPSATTTTTTLAVPPAVCPSGATSTAPDACVAWKAQDAWSGSPPAVYTASFTPFAP